MTTATVVALALLTGTSVQAQPSGVVLETYVSPVDYMHAVYASPAENADYLFFAGDPVSFDLSVHNSGNAPVSIRLNSDLWSQLALVGSSPFIKLKPLKREAAQVGSNARVREPGSGPDMPVTGDTGIILNPTASLVVPVSLRLGTEWRGGGIHVEADVSLTCTPSCVVKPHSNVFRLEVRDATSQADRMEIAYRRALRGMLAGDLGAAEQALKTLDSERVISPSALYLHGLVAERRGDRTAALTYYRAADAAMRSRSNPVELARMGSGFDDFLWVLQSKIAWLTQPKK